MPEVFNLYGFSFFFYSREHSPIHIHVQGAEGEAKFDLIGEEFVLVEQYNIKANDMKRIKSAIKDNKQRIIEKWNKHFED